MNDTREMLSTLHKLEAVLRAAERVVDAAEEHAYTVELTWDEFSPLRDAVENWRRSQ